METETRPEERSYTFERTGTSIAVREKQTNTRFHWTRLRFLWSRLVPTALLPTGSLSDYVSCRLCVLSFLFCGSLVTLRE